MAGRDHVLTGLDGGRRSGLRKPLPVTDHARRDIELTAELGQRLLAGQDPWTVLRLNAVLKTRLPSAFRRCSPMGPPVASYVPTVSSRNGEHSSTLLGFQQGSR